MSQIQKTSTGGGGGGVVINTVSVTLTSPQVKALHETPITVLAAQGAGTIIIALSVSAKLNYGGTSPFTGGGQVNLFYLADLIDSFTESFTCVTESQTSINLYTLVTGMSVVPSSSVENQSIVVSNPGTDFTGNAANDNTLTIQMQYIVITL